MCWLMKTLTNESQVETNHRRFVSFFLLFLLVYSSCADFHRFAWLPEMRGRKKSQPATRISKRLAMKPTPKLPTLPPELWTKIFAYLSAPEFCAAKSVCRHWRHLVSTTPIRAMCEFGNFTCGRGGRMVENESLGVRMTEK
jgi:hypothetical protein